MKAGLVPGPWSLVLGYVVKAPKRAATYISEVACKINKHQGLGSDLELSWESLVTLKIFLNRKSTYSF